jgi:molybdopterin converting factor small subunit
MSVEKFLSNMGNWGGDLGETASWVHQRTVLVFLNGTNIQSLKTMLKDGDALLVLPVVSGG